MVPRWRFFGEFLGPAFPASGVQHVSDLHSKFALRPHYVWKYVRPLRLGEERKKEEEDRNYMMKIYMVSLLHRATINRMKRYGPTKLCDGAEMAIFCVLYLQRAACSRFQTCILNSH